MPKIIGLNLGLVTANWSLSSDVLMLHRHGPLCAAKNVIHLWFFSFYIFSIYLFIFLVSLQLHLNLWLKLNLEGIIKKSDLFCNGVNTHCRFTSECTPVSGCRRCDCNKTQIKAVTQNKRHCGTRKFTYGTTIVSDKVRCECSRSQMNKTLPLNPSPNRRESTRLQVWSCPYIKGGRSSAWNGKCPLRFSLPTSHQNHHYGPETNSWNYLSHNPEGARRLRPTNDSCCLTLIALILPRALCLGDPQQLNDGSGLGKKTELKAGSS